MDIKVILDTNIKNESDAKHLLSEIRIVLESKNLLKKFRVIKFYSDWILHPQKDNISDLDPYFSELAIILNEYEVLPTKLIEKRLNSFLSFDSLRSEINQFITEIIHIQSTFNSVSEWQNFCRFLRHLITDKPIYFNKFKQDKNKRKIISFELSNVAPIMIAVQATYWILQLNTSDFPLVGVIFDSIYNKKLDKEQLVEKLREGKNNGKPILVLTLKPKNLYYKIKFFLIKLKNKYVRS